MHWAYRLTKDSDRAQGPSGKRDNKAAGYALHEVYYGDGGRAGCPVRPAPSCD
jgi:hypothetical protein